MASNKPERKIVVLKNVRISFPSIFNKAVFEGVEKNYEATLLIDKDEQSDLVDMVKAEAEEFAIGVFGKGKVPKSLKYTCIVDGDTKDYDGYENCVAVKGTNQKRMVIVDRDGVTPVAADDDKLEGGDYCNAMISFWYSEHDKGGKQILANLWKLQFVSVGERFGGATMPDNEFDEMDDEDDEY
jgi:hypothetical protein